MSNDTFADDSYSVVFSVFCICIYLRPVLVEVEEALLQQQHARHEHVVEALTLRRRIARALLHCVLIVRHLSCMYIICIDIYDALFNDV